MTTGPDDSEAFSLKREFELRRNAGRVLAAALARLIEAYESSPERARHAISWEHLLPGKGRSPNPMSERDEASARRSSDAAKRVVQTSMLHVGEAPLSEYSQLLDDWSLISGSGEEESFKLDEYLGHHHLNWDLTGEGLTPSERRRLHGWSMEDVELLRQRDPEMASAYEAELEEAVCKLALRGEDRKLRIQARMADVDSAVNRKLLEARARELGRLLARWEWIEKERKMAENTAAVRFWCELNADERPSSPESDSREFPENLPPEMIKAYLGIAEIQRRVWVNGANTEFLDEFEAELERLITMSKEHPDSPELVRFVADNEERRKENGRIGIPFDHGWYEYCSLWMDDDANWDKDIGDQKRADGKLWIQWAKELIGLLPSIVDRSAHLDAHPLAKFADDVPTSLRLLFEQAHLSYILGLEIPCTLTCGALVEEAFQVRFKEMFEGWDQERRDARKRGEKPHDPPFWEKVDRVVEQNPIARPARQPAQSVWYARNSAMHNPQEYLRQGRYRSEAILSDARKVLQFLFDPDKTQ
jgi:hypothetical protein